MPEQIVIKEAGVPGAQDSYYSELITLETPGAGDSPPTFGYTLIPDIGFIMFKDLAADISVVLKTGESPDTYVTIIAASGQGMIWSDGTNCFVANANVLASPNTDSVSYFVLAQKP